MSLQQFSVAPFLLKYSINLLAISCIDLANSNVVYKCSIIFLLKFKRWLYLYALCDICFNLQKKFVVLSMKMLIIILAGILSKQYEIILRTPLLPWA